MMSRSGLPLKGRLWDLLAGASDTSGHLPFELTIIIRVRIAGITQNFLSLSDFAGTADALTAQARSYGNVSSRSNRGIYLSSSRTLRSTLA